jgi:hypothetical protein
MHFLAVCAVLFVIACIIEGVMSAAVGLFAKKPLDQKQKRRHRA